MAPTPSSVTSRAEFGDEYAPNQVHRAGLVVLPCEHPSSVQWEKYFEDAKSEVTKNHWLALVRGTTTSAFEAYVPKDLAQYPELVEAGNITAAMVATRDKVRADILHENDALARKKAALVQELQEGFADWICESLRDHAGLRLDRLKKAHVKLSGTPQEWYDGVAMWKELIAAGKAKTSPEDADDFKLKLDALVADKLADGCHVQDLCEKANVFQRDINPHLAMKYEGENLSRLFLSFIPKSLSESKGMLIRELENASKMNDPAHVLMQVERVVRGGQRLGVAPVQMCMGVQMAAVEAQVKTKSMRERKAAARKSGAFKFLDDLPMPQGKKCKSGTCKMDHKGECFRDPRVGGGYLPKAMTDKALELWFTCN